MPRALITGVTGQDGWYLSELLHAADFELFGLVLPGDANPLPPDVAGIEGDARDAASLEAALTGCRPDIAYNLASISSVAESWRHPELAADINGLGTLRLLAAIQSSGRPVRLVQAGSAEIFGEAPPPQDEQTPIHPVTPYGAAKAFAHHCVSAYRAAGVWAASAILYNHESPRRPEQFVTRKITKAVAAIATGGDEPLVLGNVSARRDWGYARDYMQALCLIGSASEPADFVIATGVALGGGLRGDRVRPRRDHRLASVRAYRYGAGAGHRRERAARQRRQGTRRARLGADRRLRRTGRPDGGRRPRPPFDVINRLAMPNATTATC